jgi:tetratricopeptide (TPR) repeat protein
MINPLTVSMRLSALAGLGAGARTDEPAADGYLLTTSWLRRMYWTIPAPRLYPAVAAHARLGTQLMRSVDSPAMRSRLGPAVAETGMLAGRIACFDLDAPVDAERFYRHAFDAATAAGDRPLADAVTTHQLFLPGTRPADLADLADHAELRNGDGSSALQHAWRYAVTAELATRSADHDGAQAALESGRSALQTVGRSETPEWLDYFDAGRLEGFAGFCHLGASRIEDACEALRQSLQALTPDTVKQRTVVLADLASARARQGDLEEPCSLLAEALAILPDQWYAAGWQRIQTVHGQISRVSDSLSVRELGDAVQSWKDALTRGRRSGTGPDPAG